MSVRVSPLRRKSKAASPEEPEVKVQSKEVPAVELAANAEMPPVAERASMDLRAA